MFSCFLFYIKGYNYMARIISINLFELELIKRHVFFPNLIIYFLFTFRPQSGGMFEWVEISDN